MKVNKTVLVLVFIVSIFGCNTSFAQELAIKEGTYVLNDITYKVGAVNEYGSCVVYRKKQPQLESISSDAYGHPYDYLGLTLTNEDILKKRVRVLFGKNKCDALGRAGERVTIYFTFDQEGKVIDIFFGVNGNSILTLLDIAAIDKDLRENYTGTFKSDFNVHKNLQIITLLSDIEF